MASTISVVDFLLEDLEELLFTHNSNLIPDEKPQIETLHQDIQFIRSFLVDSGVDNEYHINELKRSIHKATSEALDHLDSFLVNITAQNLLIKSLIQDIKLIKDSVMETYHKKPNNNNGAEPRTGLIHATKRFLRVSSGMADNEETVVGFDEEIETVRERLVGVRKTLEVIPIVGMAGIGKTTLAAKVFNDPYVKYRFYIRGWTTVSQVYQERDLLLRILTSFVEYTDEEINEMTDQKVRESLYRNLKGRRYLLVIDDIWDVEAWHALKDCCPKDNNGSRILITTRLKTLALFINPDGVPHCVRLLSRDKSWDLLEQKVFGKGSSCPTDLIEIGKNIAKKCGGLPLAIATVGGLLTKRERTQESWEQIAGKMSTYIAGEGNQFMNILALSYKHLPSHLKPCFLYFGLFSKRYEIPAWRLMWLWIAEGFVKPDGERSLEAIAEDYLIELTNRNLVAVTKQSSTCGIKACRIHDMLWDLCLIKATENNFFHHIDYRYGIFEPTRPPDLQECFCFHSHGYHPTISGEGCAPNIRSVFYYSYNNPTISFIYKILKVLDLQYISLNDFPIGILQLIHLRFLRLRLSYSGRLPPLISNLWKLETLIIDEGEWGSVTIPHDFWKMVKLRHLKVSNEIDFEIPSSGHGYPHVLENIQTICGLPLLYANNDIGKAILDMTPNIRKLTFSRGLSQSEKASLPDLSNLTHLERLKLVDNSFGAQPMSIPQPNKVPSSLKKLTLSGGSSVRWKEITKLGKLPNLEVLIIRDNFFKGSDWVTNDGEFLRLKHLRLELMDLQHWITSSSHFPSLQHLVLKTCIYLMEVPLCLGDISTLQIIELSGMMAAKNSAMSIHREQQNKGNDDLKVHITSINWNHGDDDDSEFHNSERTQHTTNERTRKFGDLLASQQKLLRS